MRKLLLPIAAYMFLPLCLISASFRDTGSTAGAAGSAVFIGWMDNENWLAARNGHLRLVEALSGSLRSVFWVSG